MFINLTAVTSAASCTASLSFSLPLAGYDSVVTSDDQQFGIFAQDDWTVNDHLTLNLGIRWDIEWNESYLDSVTPQFFLDSIATLVDTNNDGTPDTPYRDTLMASADPSVRVDLNDYISTGNNRSANVRLAKWQQRYSRRCTWLRTYSGHTGAICKRVPAQVHAWKLMELH